MGSGAVGKTATCSTGILRVLAAPLLLQLPADVSGKAAADDSDAWASAILVGDLMTLQAVDSWLWPGPGHYTIGGSGRTDRFLSLCLSLYI